ncbi:MAG: transporter substrate-binding domain-containing protein [Rickettsiales bacterium]|jgi:ABC-type amino acid transport substrate-binding protein|nr:transporter substrate-binding domain-containing protein [Rickettsiales bacterium]
MKRLVLYIYIFVLLVNIASFASAKVLKVATGTGIVPYCYRDDKDVITGFDVEVIREVGKRLGYELKIDDMEFAAVIPAIMSGKYDVLASAMSITKARGEKVDFSIPYHSGATTSIGVKADNKSIKNINDLKGKTVSTITGSIQSDLLSDIGGVNVVEYATITDALIALYTGKSEASLTPTASLLTFIKDRGQGKIKAVEGEISTKGVGLAVKKGNKKLLAEINKALESMKGDGTLDKITNKFFPPKK